MTHRPSRVRFGAAVLGGSVVAAAALVAGAAPSSAAGATQAGTVLTIVGTSNADLVEIDVRPDGVLEIKNAPLVTPGTLFSGVSEVRIYTGSDPDTIDLLIESSIKVIADTATNADSVKAEVKAGTTGTMVVSLEADTSTNSDSVEVKAESKGANLDLSVIHTMSTNDDKVFVEVKGEGQADWLRATLRTREAVSNDVAAMSVTSDARDVYVTMGPDFDVVFPTPWNPTPTPSRVATVESILTVDHKAAAGTVYATLDTLSPKTVVELKGSATNKVVNGFVTGSSRNDDLIVFTEGPSSGNLVTNGSYGYDVCKTTVGTKVSCEAS
jgi:hypothetical protein